MPLELIDDIVEDLADKLGVYGAHEEDEKQDCRCCFRAGLTDRIRAACRVEQRLGYWE